MNDLTTALQISLSALLFLTFWHFGWRRFLLDHLRQGLWTDRDHLFDLVAEKRIVLSFDNPLYGALRKNYNNTIRFSHRLNLFQIVLSWFLISTKQKAATRSANLKAMVEAVDDDVTRQELMALYRRFSDRLMCYLVMRSPVLLPLVALVFLLALLVGLVRLAANHAQKSFKSLLSDMVDSGRLGDELVIVTNVQSERFSGGKSPNQLALAG